MVVALKVAVCAFVTSVAMLPLIWIRIAIMGRAERNQFRYMDGREAVSSHPVLSLMMVVCILAFVASIISVVIACFAWAVGA